MSRLNQIWTLLKFQFKRNLIVLIVCSGILASFIVFLFSNFYNNMRYVSYYDFYQYIPELTSQIFYISDTIIILVVILLYSTLISSEFDEKTGYILIPKVSKSKLMLGKYLGNFGIIFLLNVIKYITYGILLSLVYHPEYGNQYSAYGIRIFFSFGLSNLYLAAVASLITLFSALIKKSELIILISIPLYFSSQYLAIGISLLFLRFGYLIEPVFSISYASRIIENILILDFPLKINARYSLSTFYISPTIPTAVMIFTFYIITYLCLALLSFKKKEFRG